MIEANDLSKSFTSKNKELARSWPERFFAPPSRQIQAVRHMSFSIFPGERVAFIGPNGAGKSTTLKMLTGMLRPTAGTARVAGLVPWEERRELAYRIGIVFGQRSQLWYQLPVSDSFNLLARIYGVEPKVYARRLDRLAETFMIKDLIGRPVSELSLGQRLRCEIAASLIHAPDILLLDEPTIGLDVTAKAAMREHLRSLAEEDGTTVLLTTHDTGDIEKICERVIVIDRGSMILDEPLERLRGCMLQHRIVVLTTAEERPGFDLLGVEVVESGAFRLTLKVDTAVASMERVVGNALHRLDVRDIAVEPTPLEDIIRSIYRGEITKAPAREPA